MALMSPGPYVGDPGRKCYPPVGRQAMIYNPRRLSLVNTQPMRLITSFLALFIAFAAIAQDKITLGPKDSDYYKYKRRTAVMHEDFNDDSKSWIGLNPPVDARTKIADGMFQLDSTQHSWYIDIPIHDVRDFEIEFVAKIDQKKGRHRDNSIHYGDTTCGLHGLHFSFSDIGAVDMFSCQYGDCEKKKTHHYVFSDRRSFNKYSIRKLDHEYYVFVNDVYRFTWPFMPLRGDRFFIIPHPKSKVLFDYIKISYLN